MVELELSVMLGSSDELKELQALLDSFATSRHIQVRLSLLEWTAAWGEIVQAAIHGHGPDVSEIGVSWLADLVGMNALLPLPIVLSAQLGDSSQYLKGSWNACMLQNDPNMWAAPWFAGTRVLYYRRDWLGKAGLDAQSAFASAAALDATLAKLQASGVERPWVVNTHRSTSTVHHLTSWVWGAGGHFLSPDGKAVMFAEKEALDGMEAFFRLGRFLGPDPAKIDDSLAPRLFWGGQAGVTLDGQWEYSTKMRTIAPALAHNIG
jgi:multiple sugar transport system substrate-binding protein